MADLSDQTWFGEILYQQIHYQEHDTNSESIWHPACVCFNAVLWLCLRSLYITLVVMITPMVSTVMFQRNGQHFVDGIFKFVFLQENYVFWPECQQSCFSGGWLTLRKYWLAVMVYVSQVTNHYQIWSGSIFNVSYRNKFQWKSLTHPGDAYMNSLCLKQATSLTKWI